MSKKTRDARQLKGLAQSSYDDQLRFLGFAVDTARKSNEPAETVLMFLSLAESVKAARFHNEYCHSPQKPIVLRSH